MKQSYLLLASLLLLLGTAILQAQQMPPIPVDNKVRTGKLENGLTYFIRENKLPENRADFYIVQKVGSILEEENQRGWHTSWNIWPLTDQQTSPVEKREEI